MYRACGNLHGTEEKAKFCSRKALPTLTDFMSNLELRSFHSLLFSKYPGEVSVVFFFCPVVPFCVLIMTLRLSSRSGWKLRTHLFRREGGLSWVPHAIRCTQGRVREEGGDGCTSFPCRWGSLIRLRVKWLWGQTSQLLRFECIYYTQSKLLLLLLRHNLHCQSGQQDELGCLLQFFPAPVELCLQC